jgi:hypothetical protein
LGQDAQGNEIVDKRRVVLVGKVDDGVDDLPENLQKSATNSNYETNKSRYRDV